jgi:gamma-glutamyltranspeptidase / glutathione hydrolase
MRLFKLLAALSLILGCSVPATAAATGPKGLVSAADPRAAEAGAEMLRKGGTAADAAFATLLALNVVEPQSSGIGGGGFLVYSDHGQPPLTYDGRETAPMAATGTWFFRDGRPMPIAEAIPGGKSVGVPGNIRLMAAAHRDFGKLRWADLFGPAIRLARDGFAITPRLYRVLNANRETGALSSEARALFYGADGNARPVGTVVRNPRFAAFLEQLAKLGPDAFYVGPNAQAIVAAVNGAPRNPSQMTAGDIAAYDAKKREPVCGTYRGYRICGMAPVSSGGTTVFAILKQLERFDLAALGPRNATSWHLIAESMRLAFADRDRYIADPAFVPVPAQGLMEDGYLLSRGFDISPTKTLHNVAAGIPEGAPVDACMILSPERGTSHFVVVDRQGNVASQTSTIESAFGSGLMVNGYYLNNELTDFSLSPAANGCPVANRVEGGKRPRSSMSPTIVYGPDGHVRLAVGAAGGATIIAQVAKAIIGVIDWKLSAQQAIALPTIFAPGGDTVYLERGTFLEPMAPQLQALGHSIAYRPPSTFKANAIEWVNGRWVGAADPRSEGAVVAE